MRITSPELLGSVRRHTGHADLRRRRSDRPVCANTAAAFWHVHFKQTAPRRWRLPPTRGARRMGLRRWPSDTGCFASSARARSTFEAVTRELRTIAYDGWIVVEQDVLPSLGTPPSSRARIATEQPPSLRSAHVRFQISDFRFQICAAYAFHEASGRDPWRGAARTPRPRGVENQKSLVGDAFTTMPRQRRARAHPSSRNDLLLLPASHLACQCTPCGQSADTRCHDRRTRSTTTSANASDGVLGDGVGGRLRMCQESGRRHRLQQVPGAAREHGGRTARAA